MTYKSMLAVVQSEREADHLIDSAVALAERFGAHLIGFHPELVQVSYAMAAGFPDAEFLRDATERSASTTRALAGKFGHRLESTKLSNAWATMETLPGDTSAGALRLARSTDLVVAAQPDPSSEAPETDALLSDSGRPVLVIPRGHAPFDPMLRRIVIGWNGSKEAARAVFDALPLLKEAEFVEVLVVDPEERRPGAVKQGEGIAATLARHGIHVQLVAAEKGRSSVEVAIVQHCSSAKADLLVLGAYGHSWLREFLFGGVTRGVLDRAPIATFMSH
jgi:nucleotide-binding universal stress UspA family protein